MRYGILFFGIGGNKKTDLAFFFCKEMRRDVKLKSCHTHSIYSIKLNIDGYPFGSPIRQEYPLNLSILLSGGKETNKDSLSKGD
jgi:hypothetical protein